MAKLSVPAAIGLVYVMIAVGIVHFEGEAHRRALRAQVGPLALAKESTEGANPEPDLSTSAPESSSKKPAEPEAPPEAAHPAEAVAPEPEPEPKPAKKPARPPGSAPARKKAARKSAPKAEKPPEPPPTQIARNDPTPALKRPDPAPAPAPAAPNENELKLLAAVVPNLVDIPAAEEQKVGELLHDLILSKHAEDPNSRFARPASEAIRPLLDTRARKDIEVKIVILDSDEVNAFSHLGGYIYLTRGFFSLAATDEEYMFVLGHELAHIDLKHQQKQVAEAMASGAVAGFGTFPYLYHQIAEGFSVERENEADAWILDRMIKLDCSQRDCAAFLRKLKPYSEDKDHAFPNGRLKPKTDVTAPIQDIGNAIRSIPAPWQRLDKISARFKAR